MSTKNPTNIRPKYVKVPHDAICAICGITRPLDNAHIIPQRLLKMLPDIDRRFFDHDGINVFYLCKNHHALYDRGLLPKEDMYIIFPQVFHAILELYAHIYQGALPQKHFKELQAYIASLTYHEPE